MERSTADSEPKTCFKCSHQRLTSDIGPEYSCPKCGAVYAKTQALRAEHERLQALVTSARRSGVWSQVPPEILQRELLAITVTTTDTLPGQTCSNVMGIVAGEYSYAFGAIFESVAGLIRNIAGSGKSGMTTRMLKEGRRHAIANMQLEALLLGAQAVVGVRIDFEEFSGANGQGIIVVVATGSAVSLKPLP